MMLKVALIGMTVLFIFGGCAKKVFIGPTPVEEFSINNVKTCK